MRVKNISILQFFILYITLFPLLFGATDGAVKSYAILTLSIMVFLGTYILNIYKNIPNNLLVLIIKIIIVSILFILIPSLAFSNTILFNDIFEIHRPILYSLVFLLAFTINWDSMKIKKILKTFLVIIIINIIFSILQPLGIIDSISYFYAIPQNYFFMHRASGTFPAPYDLGYVFTLAYLFFALQFVYYKKIIQLLMILLIIVTVMLTQSKTAMMLIAISTFTLIFINIIILLSSKKNSKYKKNSKQVILVYVFLLVFIIFLIVINYELLFERYSYLIGGLELFLSGQDNGTLTTRFSQVRYILNGFDSNILTILFGNGINKDLARYLESYYIMYQFRYGFIGLSLSFIVYFILPIYFSFKAFKNTINQNRELNILFMSLFIWYLVTPIACLGNSFMDIPRVNFIYFFFYGLSYYFSKRRNIEKFSINNNPLIQ